MRGITQEELDLLDFLDLTPTRRTFTSISIEEIGNENKDNLILEEKKEESDSLSDFKQSLKDFFDEAEFSEYFICIRSFYEAKGEFELLKKIQAAALQESFCPAPPLNRGPLIAINGILLTKIKESAILPAAQENILIRIICTSLFERLIHRNSSESFISESFIKDFVIANRLKKKEVKDLREALEGKKINSILFDYLNRYSRNGSKTDWQFLVREFYKFWCRPVSTDDRENVDDKESVIDFFRSFIKRSDCSIEETKQEMESQDDEIESPNSLMLRLINQRDSLWLSSEARNRMIKMLKEDEDYQISELTDLEFH
ncbi:hypothetical protein [Coxiella burnetii]|uniref:hypothetical protein n=1 Tax=Coxiella burnetii TaxID=777 RepID=UPI0022327E7C|nr:hypothetical protein [Coxiella burnetii]